MAFAFLVVALWATTIAAQGCDISGEEGFGLGPGDPGTDVQRAVMEAAQHPNITNEVQFQFTRPGVSANDQNDASNQWSWRANITEINFGSLPSNPGYLHYAGNAADFNFVNTVNSLSWPGGGELSDEIARVTGNASGNAGRLCVSVLDLPILPANITNQYDPGDDGNCANVIGASCAQALLRAAAPGAGGCNSGPQYLPGEIPECKSTLSQARCDGIATFELANTTHASLMSPRSNDSSSMTPFKSGDAFYFFASGAEAAGNNSYLQKASQQLRVLMLTGAANQIVCQKVNMTDITISSAPSSRGVTWYILVVSFGIIALFSQL